MEEQTCFGKIIDITNGVEMYLRKIPCVIGRVSNSDNLNYKDKKQMIGKTIDIDLNYCNLSEINDYCVRHKLVTHTCKRISPAHLIIYFDFKKKEFKIKALNSVYVNETQICETSESQAIKTFDRIAFDCDLCFNPHVFVLIFPKTSREEEVDLGISMGLNIGFNMYTQGMDIESINRSDDNFKNTISGEKSNKRMPDTLLANKWTSHEKESLRKYILIYGYGRWKILKQNSGGVLSDKSEVEIKIFANAFVKTIVELLPQEKSELRKFLINLLDEGIDEPFIAAKRDDWGNLIKQRAPAWGKRIQLLCRVCLIIEKFKTERGKNKEKRKHYDKIDNTVTITVKIENNDHLVGNGDGDGDGNGDGIGNLIKNELSNNENNDNNNENKPEEENKIEINKTYDYWDNLLNFLPNHAFYGQRLWWTRTHDIDLLRGTYKYGYANYQMMRSDPKLSFSKLEKDTSFQEFPNADTITRRLKKLIQIIIKSESSNGTISFEDRKSIKEPTGFSLEEKNKIVQSLIDQGVPLNSEGKSDWVLLKDQLVTGINLDSSKTAQMIERLVQRLRLISQLVIQLNENMLNENEASIDENMLEQMDPDNDGFNILFEEAEKLNKNMNILHFIRKHVLTDHCRLFNNGLNSLIEAAKTNSGFLPSNWDCSVHDKNLLFAVEENGFNYLNQNSAKGNLLNIPFTNAVARINFLCEFFRDYSTGNKSKKKRDNLNIVSMLSAGENVSSNLNLNQRKKTSKLNIQRDEEGNIIYPIIINSALQILYLGRIENERSFYHTEKNLFPIGYKAIREHASMTKLGERALYTCEILDGGSKPMYKLTPHEDHENPIIKESSTGCWIVVCNRINAMQGNKRNKVTISGTERFGLCENNVVKLLQSLPNADRCSRYLIKTFEE